MAVRSPSPFRSNTNSAYDASPSTILEPRSPLQKSERVNFCAERTSFNPDDNDSQVSKPTYDPAEYKPEWKKTFCIFALLIAAICLNHLALAGASEIAGRNPLPDLIHSLIIQKEHYRTLFDIFATIGTTCTILFISLFHKHRSIVMRRLFYIASILYIMRACTISVTNIPPSFEDNGDICMEPSDQDEPPYHTIFNNFASLVYTFGLQVKLGKGNRIFCGDMLFSGHTTASSLCCFMLNHYSPKSLWPLRILLMCFNVGAMVGAVISRAHYTVDVVIGYWICSLFFSYYHAYTYVPHRQRTFHRPFRRLITFWTMYWIERNVPPGRIPNELDWPLPWPKSAQTLFEAWNRKSRHTRCGRIARALVKYRIKLHV